jgi:hypothetical protein
MILDLRLSGKQFSDLLVESRNISAGLLDMIMECPYLRLKVL